MDLDNLRNEIDKIDDELIKLFRRRMEIVNQVANYKKKNNLPTLDQNREKSKIATLAKKLPAELSTYIHPLYNTLFEISRHYQQQQEK